MCFSRKIAGTTSGKSNNADFVGLTPETLLVAVRLGAFPAFMFVHFQTTFFLEISHFVGWFVIKKVKVQIITVERSRVKHFFFLKIRRFLPSSCSREGESGETGEHAEERRLGNRQG